MKTQSHLWLWQFGSYVRYRMLSSCIYTTLVSVCAMKGIPIEPLAQWGKELAYYHSPLLCLKNWDMYYPGGACRGKDLPPGINLHTYLHTYEHKGAKGDWDFRISDLIKKKTLVELIFNPCGEFQWSPEGPVSQIHSPYLHTDAPGIFLDLLKFVQMLKRECGEECNGKLPHLFIPGKTAAWFLSLRWKTCLRQNCSLGSCACSEWPALGQNILMIWTYVR